MSDLPYLPTVPLTPERVLDLFTGWGGRPPMDTAAIAELYGRPEAEVVRLLAEAREAGR